MFSMTEMIFVHLPQGLRQLLREGFHLAHGLHALSRRLVAALALLGDAIHGFGGVVHGLRHLAHAGRRPAVASLGFGALGQGHGPSVIFCPPHA